MSVTPPVLPDPETSDARKGIQSVEIGLRVASVMAEANGPLALKDIARASGLAGGAAHRYLVSLSRSGLVVQRADGRYELGGLALRLGFAALARIDPMAVTERHLEAFVETTGNTAMLTLWSAQGPIVMRWVQGSPPVYTTISLGSTMPLATSATGAVFAAWLDPATLAPLRDTLARPARTALDAHADTVRRTGFAQVAGGLVPGLHAVAMPVFDGRRALFAVITAVAAGEPISAASIDALHRTASASSAELGYIRP